MFEKSTSRAVFSLLLMTLASGCSLLGGLGLGEVGGIGEKPADNSSINSASSRGDEAYLEKVCNGETPARQDSDKEYACNRLERLRAPKKALAVSCDDLQKAYEDAPKDDRKFVAAMSEKMAECGHYPYLFEHVIHWGNNNEGVEILQSLEKNGKPVEEEFGKYLESHKGAMFFATTQSKKNDVLYGIAHITKWLMGKGSTQHCAAIANAATGANIYARVSVMTYFKEAKCKEGVPLATELLAEDMPGDRTLGCRILGAIGDASVLGKVKIVAETDGYSTIKEEERNGRVWATKVYPVRDACLEASGKIKLRK